MLTRLARPAVVQGKKSRFVFPISNIDFQYKREISTHSFSGIVSHFWKRSLLDLHWPVAVMLSLPPLWELFQNIVYYIIPIFYKESVN